MLFSSTSPTELYGTRVMLRPMRNDDFAAWSEIRLRCIDWLVKWEPMSHETPEKVARDRRGFEYRCSVRAREWQMGTGYGFGVFLLHEKQRPQLVGELNVSNVLRGPLQNASAGYWIDQAVAGRGLMPEALVVLFRYLFDDLGLHRVEIPIVPRNAASRRVVEKLGLREEGVAVRFLEIDGIWEDHVRYAITSEEWEVHPARA